MAALLMMPALIFLAGTGHALAGPSGGMRAGTLLTATFAAAVVAPLVAALVLSRLMPGFDPVLFGVAAALTAIGATTLLTLAFEAGADRSFYATIATRHAAFIVLGFIALIIGAACAGRIDQVSRYPYSLLALALLLTSVTVAAGQTVNGARLWLEVGPARFQPSEIARVLLAGFMAIYLYDRRHLVSAPWRMGRVDLPAAPYLLPLGVAVLGAVAVLILQNDLGMAALIALATFATVAAVVRSRVATAIAAMSLAAAAIGAYLVVPRFQLRVAGWLEPWQNPARGGFQFVQADYALATGGALGAPTAEAALRVPEAHTDFILIAVANRFGTLTACAVLVLTVVLVCRCVLNAFRTRGGIGAYVALTLAALIGIQVILIAGGTLRVLPLTGLTLALVSYGGTSLVATLFALGVVLGIGAGQAQQA